MTRYEPIAPTPAQPAVVAHRGSSGTVPENTLAALERAVTEGAAILEVDAHLTLDGELVVIHDDTLLRTTDAAESLPGREPWNVRDLTLEEIRSVSAGTWEGERLQVPTLREVVDLVRRHDVGLLIETKYEFAGDALEPAIAALVHSYDDWEAWVAGRLMIGSFSWESLLRAQQELPGVNLAFIVVYLVAKDGKVVGVEPFPTEGVVEPGMALVDVRDALVRRGVANLGLAVLGIDGDVVNDFTRDTIERFREGGVEINVITDDPAEMAAHLDRGVSSLLTNHPERAARVIAARA